MEGGPKRQTQQKVLTLNSVISKVQAKQCTLFINKIHTATELTQDEILCVHACVKNVRVRMYNAAHGEENVDTDYRQSNIPLRKAL